MRATFVPDDIESVEAGRTILQGIVTGHVITVSVTPGSSKRVVLLVSAADHDKVTRDCPEIEVTDLITGEQHVLIGAPCGLGCRCAITFKEEQDA